MLLTLAKNLSSSAISLKSYGKTESKIGQNRLFEWLRENGFLIKCKGERWNMPTQYSLERDLFEVKTRVINNPDGTTRIVRTTKVTGKGQIFFVNKFLNALHEKAVGANA